MTLEQLCEKMMDDWRSGSYTQAYEDADAMLSGSQMRDIFIEEAKKKADVSEPGELESYADHLEEAIDEGIANLQQVIKYGPSVFIALTKVGKPTWGHNPSENLKCDIYATV